MTDINLPFWLEGEELNKLTESAKKWFDQTEKNLEQVLNFLNPETCPLQLLELFAWQRGIDLLRQEPEKQLRLRIKYAYENAKDAGSRAGLIKIFSRLELGYVEIFERLEGRDWDIIQLQITDNSIAHNAVYLDWIIQTYGRTCRRYEWKLITPLELKLQSVLTGCDYQTFLID